MARKPKPGPKPDDLGRMIRQTIAVMRMKKRPITPDKVLDNLIAIHGSPIVMLSGPNLATASRAYIVGRINSTLKNNHKWIIGSNRERVPFWEATIPDLEAQESIRYESSDFDQPSMSVITKVREFLHAIQGQYDDELTPGMFIDEVMAIYDSEGIDPPPFYSEEEAA
jgi:hypothetical protein